MLLAALAYTEIPFDNGEVDGRRGALMYRFRCHLLILHEKYGTVASASCTATQLHLQLQRQKNHVEVLYQVAEKEFELLYPEQLCTL